jgi:hypothetical protein
MSFIDGYKFAPFGLRAVMVAGVISILPAVDLFVMGKEFRHDRSVFSEALQQVETKRQQWMVQKDAFDGLQKQVAELAAKVHAQVPMPTGNPFSSFLESAADAATQSGAIVQKIEPQTAKAKPDGGQSAESLAMETRGSFIEVINLLDTLLDKQPHLQITKLKLRGDDAVEMVKKLMTMGVSSSELDLKQLSQVTAQAELSAAEGIVPKKEAM